MNVANHEKEIVEDGQILRVNLLMMDSTQRAVHDSQSQLTDGRGNPAGQRPGFLCSDDAELKKTQGIADAVRQTQIKMLSQAWRNPPAVNTSQPAQPTTDVYQSRNQRLQNAWRA